jgi:class 3 adenylate cyclase/PAS domain-containing protein
MCWRTCSLVLCSPSEALSLKLPLFATLRGLLGSIEISFVGIDGGNCVVSADLSGKIGDELRSMSTAMMHISRLLHDHARKLEIAVEGTYASQGGDPRVRLLSDSLHVSRKADLELGRISQNMQRTVTLAQQIASAASDAMFAQERAELTTSISTLQEERNEIETLYEIARTLNSTLDFNKVLSLVMDQVIGFLKAERGFLMLINPQTGEPEFRMARDNNARTIPETAFNTAQISRNIVKEVIHTQKPILTDDALNDKDLKGHESILAYNIHALMCAPLMVRNSCIGAVYVDSRLVTRLFSPRHLNLLLAFCNQAAIAIDNARLFADLNRAIQQVREDKQYMDNIFGSIANGVVTTDANGTITTFNAAASMILRIHPEKALNKHYRDVFQLLPANIGLIDLLVSAQSQHEHGTIVDRSVSCSIPGREKEEEINLNFYASSLRDMQDQYIGIALVIDDQTALKRSEARAKKIRHIFERYVHPNVVEQLIRDPLALNLGGETKEISVVFADIRGYTRLSESMPPEEVMNLINRYLKIMCEAIWEEEGTLTAFQGDALMAIFNAPLQQDDHALRAVRAAWKMRTAVENYQLSHPQETQVSFGIGVNTGLATVGNVGAQERLQNYTAIGDVVNVASRLQNNVSDNKILLNDTTYQQVQHAVNVGMPFSLNVKNKSSALTVRYLFDIV